MENNDDPRHSAKAVIREEMDAFDETVRDSSPQSGVMKRGNEAG
ncbi:MAG: hypothetical protein P8N76_19895 [Pirellulaceae bacterium]|nr:hypothetical protein [Pirellulaceae bacterium]